MDLPQTGNGVVSSIQSTTLRQSVAVLHTSIETTEPGTRVLELLYRHVFICISMKRVNFQLWISNFTCRTNTLIVVFLLLIVVLSRRLWKICNILILDRLQFATQKLPNSLFHYYLRVLAMLLDGVGGRHGSQKMKNCILALTSSHMFCFIENFKTVTVFVYC